MVETTNWQESNRLRLIGSFGSNKVMAGELSRLVRRATDDCRLPEPAKHGTSSISYPFIPQVAAVAMRYHRTCARLLWELVRLRAGRLERLYEALSAWAEQTDAALPEQAGISVTVQRVEDFPAGERQIVGTVKNALIDGMKRRGREWHLAPEHPDLLFDVRYWEEDVIVSVDLAGRAMHQRGYRHRSGEAPIREDLAAMLVMLARFDARSEALIDPMAGSGTIGIEAAAMGSARTLWCSGRGPLGANLPQLAPLLANRAEPLFADTRAHVWLRDNNEDMLALQERNADTAGVLNLCELTLGPFQQWNATQLKDQVAAAGLKRALILSNPPYGVRLGTDERTLYRELGSWCRLFPGWRAAFIAVEPEFEALFGQRARVKKPLRNGPLRATFYCFDL